MPLHGGSGIASSALGSSSSASMASTDTLIDRFYHHQRAEDRDTQQGEAVVRSMAELAAGREPGTAAVRVVNPTEGEHGWSSRHTLVQVVTDDMPFIVDSVLGEITRRGLAVAVHVPLAGAERRTMSGDGQRLLHDGAVRQRGCARSSSDGPRRLACS